MSTHLKIFSLIAILVASLGVAPVSAQILESVAVTTDKGSYASGETIIISGEVRESLSGFPVTLQVIAANGNIVTLAQLDIGADKKFGIELTSGGPLWKSTGTYTVKVLYGTQSRTAETSFEFGGSGDTIPRPTGPTIGVDRTDYMLSYTIRGGSLLNVNPDDDANSLILTISTTSDGELTITMPRALIDAKLNGEDDDFFV